MYSEKALKRFKNPKSAGEIKNPSGIGKVGNLACGDVIKVYIRVDRSSIIRDAKFQTYGCVAAIAASDALCEMAKGKSTDEVLSMKYGDIVKELGGLPPVKFHCSVMGIQALKKAIENYNKQSRGVKLGKRGQGTESK